MDFVKNITINYKILLFVKEFMKSNEWRDGLEFSSKGFFFFLLTQKKTIPPPPQAFVNDFAKCFFFLFQCCARSHDNNSQKLESGKLAKKKRF